MKRIISLLACLCMLLSLVPFNVYAADEIFRDVSEQEPNNNREQANKMYIGQRMNGIFTPPTSGNLGTMVDTWDMQDNFTFYLNSYSNLVLTMISDSSDPSFSLTANDQSETFLAHSKCTKELEGLYYQTIEIALPSGTYGIFALSHNSSRVIKYTLSLTAAKAEFPLIGTCGKNITFSLDENGCLSLNGYGEMNDYDSDYISYTSPWRREVVRSLNIDSRISYIGKNAFCECNSLAEAFIPESVKEIAEKAFYSCDVLKKLTLSAGTSIHENAFESCNIKVVDFYGSIEQWEALMHVKGFENAKVNIMLQPPFIDVSNDDYYAYAVYWAVEKEITHGTSATTFSPEQICTRAQAVTFLWRAAGEPRAMSRRNPFIDVAQSAYYYEAVLWAVENGITSGTSPNQFSPDAGCTRAQAVTFLWRSAGSPKSSGTSLFNDVSERDYYNQSVIWATNEGITYGTSDTKFSPNLSCTRAQIVTFLYRFATTTNKPTEPDIPVEPDEPDIPVEPDEPTECNHNWGDATCTSDATCTKCGAVQEGTMIRHKPQSNETCAFCGEKLSCSLLLEKRNGQVLYVYGAVLLTENTVREVPSEFVIFDSMGETVVKFTNSFTYGYFVELEPGTYYVRHSYKTGYNNGIYTGETYTSTIIVL